jgi:hypothetical protein
MTNGHAAWAHLVGAGVAIQDIAADLSLPDWMRSKLSTIEALAGTSNRLTRREMGTIARALIFLGENEPRDGQA